MVYHLLENATDVGDYERVKRLLSSTRPVYARQPKDREKYQLLKNAVIKKYPLITNVLLTYVQKVNFQPQIGKPLLHIAIDNNDIEMVKVLLKNGANLNEKYEKYKVGTRHRGSDQNALHVAISKNRIEMVKLFMSKGALLHTAGCEGKTPLHMASRGRYEIAEMLLNSDEEIDVNIVDDHGQTPLFSAIDARSFDCFQLLLEHGADVHVTDYNGQSLMHIAARGAVDEMKMLMEHGVAIDSADNDGEMPVHVAARRCLKTLEILLNNGASVHDVGSKNRTPLHSASGAGFINIVKYLLNRGADLHARNLYDGNCLFEAISSGKLKMFHTLLDLGLHIDSLLLMSLYYLEELFNGKNNILLKHVALMNSLQLYVNVNFLSVIGNDTHLSQIFINCEKEIEKMKLEKFEETSIFYFDIMTRNLPALVNYARNENVVKVTARGQDSRDLKVKFPLFAEFIVEQIRKGVERRKLLDECIKKCRRIFPGLPSSVTEIILSRLSDTDWQNLIEVCKRSKKKL